MKLNRGQKLCKECGGVNACRRRKCIFCDTEFISKKTPIKHEVKNWRELRPGQQIKIIQGTGPYFIPKVDSDESAAGEKVCMGETGVYKVVRLEKNGIVGYGTSHKNARYTFIYMGPEKVSKTTGCFLVAHRLKLIKKKIRN